MQGGVSLNKYRINEGVRRSRIHKDSGPYSEGLSDVKESVSESGLKEWMRLRVMVFHIGSLTQSRRVKSMSPTQTRKKNEQSKTHTTEMC